MTKRQKSEEEKRKDRERATKRTQDVAYRERLVMNEVIDAAKQRRQVIRKYMDMAKISDELKQELARLKTRAKEHARELEALWSNHD